MKTKIIKIFCDGNKDVGFGHIRRSTSLANYFRKKEYSVELLGLSDEARKLLSNQSTYSNEEAVVIFDSPFDVSKEIEKYRNQGVKTICLDSRIETSPDLTISVYEHFKPLPPGRRVDGLEYIIIRNDLLDSDLNQLEMIPNRVLIVLGGGDLKSQSIPVAEMLLNWGYEVDLVLGPLAKQEKSLEHKNLTIHNSPSNFTALMKRCSWAISNGGGCLFELMFLGKAVHVLPQTEAEERIGNLMLSKNGILGLGLDSLRKISSRDLSFFHSKKSEIIDGNGMERILNHVEEFLYEE